MLTLSRSRSSFSRCSSSHLSLLLQVNGDRLEIEAHTSVSKLLAQLGVGTKRVAVELNLEIVPKSTYDSVVLKDGDRVEVVGFVGGG